MATGKEGIEKIKKIRTNYGVARYSTAILRRSLRWQHGREIRWQEKKTK